MHANLRRNSPQTTGAAIRDCGVSSLVELPAPSRSERAAFTLVELLVVIGIIALLISILIPVLGKARQAAIQIQCMSTLKQFGNADAMYVSAYNYHMPAWWGHADSNSAFDLDWGGITSFRKALGLPVLYDLSVGYVDPSGTGPSHKFGYRCYVPRKWYCPNSQAGIADAPPGGDPETREVYYPLHYSYGMNIMGVDSPNQLPPGVPGGGPFGSQGLDPRSFPDVWDTRAKQADPRLNVSNPPGVVAPIIFHGFKPSQVKRPAEKIHFADALYFVINVYGCGSSTFPNYPGWNRAISNYDLVGDLPKTNAPYQSQRTIAWRHNKGANVVFFDNHGEWVPKDKLYDRDAAGNPIRKDSIWKVMD
jgi:prepilin-type N-terminal cleavage/methylation domain-containing protein/prepilin-type processing-associated H-X9-DG protein